MPHFERNCGSSTGFSKVPFDEDVVKAISKGVPPVEYSSGPAAEALKVIAREMQGLFLF